VATWATFAPCFQRILLGAPYIERLRDNRALTATLSDVTAAVVGVVLNLDVTLGILALFSEVRNASFLGGPIPVPDLRSIAPFAAMIAAASFLALWRFSVNIPVGGWGRRGGRADKAFA
jgi:chromate transporter